MTGTARQQPLRILYSHYLADDDHPAVRMVHAISEQLQALGHDVLIHRCLGPAQPSAQPTSKPATKGRPSLVGRIKNRFWFARTLSRNFSTIKFDRAAIESFRPDVILAREDAYRISIVQAARQMGVPLVTYADVPVAYETRLFHSDEHWHPPGLVENLERFWLKNSRAVITPCHPAADELRKLGVPVPIRVASNGVDPAKFPLMTAEQKTRAKMDLGLPLDKTIVGFQGSFRKFHGIDLLREMMLGTTDRDDIHWLLIGDGPERERLQSSVSGRVSASFLGKQPPERMGGLVGLFDVAVSSHMFVDGSFYFCPLKILEYAVGGCAIVASDQGDIPLMLDEGRAGLILGSPDSAAWIRALRSLLDDPEGARRLGAHARQWVLERMTWRHTAEQVEQVLLTALGTASAGKIEPEPRIPDQRDLAVSSAKFG